MYTNRFLYPSSTSFSLAIIDLLPDLRLFYEAFKLNTADCILARQYHLCLLLWQCKSIFIFEESRVHVECILQLWQRNVDRPRNLSCLTHFSRVRTGSSHQSTQFLLSRALELVQNQQYYLQTWLYWSVFHLRITDDCEEQVVELNIRSEEDINHAWTIIENFQDWKDQKKFYEVIWSKPESFSLSLTHFVIHVESLVSVCGNVRTPINKSEKSTKLNDIDFTIVKTFT